MTTQAKELEIAIGTGASLIIGEHFFSTLLSSPWTTGKFVQTTQDREQVNKLLAISAVVSMIVAGAMAYVTKEKWPVIATALLVVFYIVVYQKAMNHTL